MTALFLFALLASGAPPAGAAGTLSDRAIECGVHAFQGRLRSHPGGGASLELLPGTTNQVSVALKGLTPDEHLGYRDRNVRVEARVSKRGYPGEVASQVISPVRGVSRTKALAEPDRLITKEACP